MNYGDSNINRTSNADNSNGSMDVSDILYAIKYFKL